MMEKINRSSEEQLSTEQRVSLCELLDRVLNKGAVLMGELCISVAGVELLYVAVSLMISSVETLLESMDIYGLEQKEEQISESA
jgi:hypothetical protein